MWGLTKTVTKTYLKTAVKTFKLSAFVVGVYTAGREFGRSEERGVNTTYATPIGTLDVSIGSEEKLEPLEIAYQWCGNEAMHSAHDTHKGKTTYRHVKTNDKITAPFQYRCPGVDKSGIRRIKKEQ